MEQRYEQEEKLNGGNVSAVYKKGDRVYRIQKEESPNVHKLLKHLESKGLKGVPRFLGIDEKGREILSYIEGETADYPLKDYMWSEKALKDVAVLLRQYHDATSDFVIPDGWKPIDNTPEPIEVICHNDFAVYNVIFSNQKLAGVIDFDLAAPGPRAWDIAYALYTFVPLSRRYQAESGEVIYYNPEQDDLKYQRRIQTFLDAYGWNDPNTNMLNMVLLRVEALCLTMKRKAQEGDGAFQKMIDEGHYDHYQEEYQFIKENGWKWF